MHARQLQGALASLFLTLGLTGCASLFAQAPEPERTPAAVTALPEARPQAPLEAQWVFGAVEAKRVVDSESQLIYRLDEDASRKHYGLAGSYYVTVKGQEYMLHWEYADKLEAIAVGDTVNLHPSDYATCLERPGEKPECRRLYRLYKNKRPIPPIGGT